MEPTQHSSPLTGAEPVRWDLSSFYAGIDDPALEGDVAAWEERAKRFQASYKGKLMELLGAAITEYAELTMLLDKIECYLFLLSSISLGDAPVSAKKSSVEQRLNGAAGAFLTFFELELCALPDAALDGLKSGDAVVDKHWPFIQNVRRFTPHLLSEEVEGALTKRAAFGAGAWAEYFDEVEDDLRFTFEGKEMTQKDLIHLMNYDPSAERRASALLTLDKGYAGAFEKYSAQSLWMVAGSKAVEDRERKYGHPMSARNLSNKVSDAMVEALHDAVTSATPPLAKRHYALKAKLLGREKLAWSDRNAPLPIEDTSTFPYDEAMRIVLDAYGAFSPTLAALVRKIADAKHVDAPPVPKKATGAYNLSLVAPGMRPETYVLLNYHGSTRDIMTIAHELGHAVHGLLAGEAQGPLMARAPTAYAETASVFGEMTTFNDLKGRLEAKGDITGTLALVHGKIDDMMNTVVRQIGFSNFERRLHGAGKKLLADELSALWMATLTELYGEEGDMFTYAGARRLWSYVSHFHRPFYVYGYAIGELFTQSLYAARPTFGDAFEPMYLDMLRAGGTKDAIELLRPFGLDPVDPAFWTRGIEVSLGKMVAEEERLAAMR
jgi:oligoendopeptidase F